MSQQDKPQLKDLIKVGITQGDFNGIGIEVIIKTFSEQGMFELCTPVVYSSTRVLSYHKKALGSNFNFHIARATDNLVANQLNIINCWQEEAKIELGSISEEGGKYALKSIEAAVKDLQEGKIDVLVTAPIHKFSIKQEGFQFPGHTEYFAEKFKSDDSLMLMVSDNLRIGTVTGHVALNQVSSKLSIAGILNKLSLLQKSLNRDFGKSKPKIAVLGLNPHAGENGTMGTEEQQIITPAIQQATEKGILAFGPYPADGFFGKSMFTKFDAVLAMYHDQGLVPFKTLAFESGVNYTAGLPIIRTSPDHGTAFDIAGKNVASENSFRSAIFLAMDIFRSRRKSK
jgi:4-hydroxythreonine-4-phosphate dehydrogenase